MSKDSISDLVAADVMQRDLVTIGPQDNLRDALALMTDNHITGLPVMAGRGQCIGLVGATDILNYEQEHAEETAETNAEVSQHFDPEKQQWESVRVTSFALDEFGDVSVQEVMTRDLISVRRETPLQEVAQRMVQDNVHRVLVLDEEQRLYGIVSAFDLVRIIAQS